MSILEHGATLGFSGSSLEEIFHEFAFGFEMVSAADRHKRVLVSLMLRQPWRIGWFAQAAGGEGSEDLRRASPFQKIMWFYKPGFSEFVFVEECMFRDPPTPPLES